jgi:uncharacterized membrane protein
MEETVRDVLDALVPIVEAIGGLIVFVGAITAFALWAGSHLGIRKVGYESVRLHLGRHLALGLEFQLGADILSTAISPSFEEIGKLGAIAAIRTFLQVFLARELREEEERQRATAGATPSG